MSRYALANVVHSKSAMNAVEHLAPPHQETQVKITRCQTEFWSQCLRTIPTPLTPRTCDPRPSTMIDYMYL